MQIQNDIKAHSFDNNSVWITMNTTALIFGKPLGKKSMIQQPGQHEPMKETKVYSLPSLFPAAKEAGNKCFLVGDLLEIECAYRQRIHARENSMRVGRYRMEQKKHSGY
jgi:hypothetical protein